MVGEFKIVAIFDFHHKIHFNVFNALGDEEMYSWGLYMQLVNRSLKLQKTVGKCVPSFLRNEKIFSLKMLLMHQRKRKYALEMHKNPWRRHSWTIPLLFTIHREQSHKNGNCLLIFKILQNFYSLPLLFLFHTTAFHGNGP